MRKVKILSNEQGQCPYCNGLDIDYSCAQFEGDMMYFPAHCNDCERDFEEWYELTFAGHNIGDSCCEEAADWIGEEIEMDEPDDEDGPRGNNTCPYCGKDADFVDDDENSTKYYCPHCGEDFLIHDDGTYTTRNGFPIKEENKDE